MSEAKITFRQMFERLRAEGLLSAEQAARGEEILNGKSSHTPVFLGLVLGIGAWLAGLFFTGCLLLLFDQMHIDKGGVVMAGLGYLTGATLLRRSASHIFFIQAALALALAGYFMAIFGTAETFGHDGQDWRMAAVATLLAGVVCWVNPCPILRFLLPLCATGFLLSWVVERNLPLVAGALAIAQAAALTVLLLRYRHLSGPRVLAHALMVTLAATLAVLFHQGEHSYSWGFLFWHNNSATQQLWRAVNFALLLVLALWLMGLVRWFARSVLPLEQRDAWHLHPAARAGLLACVLLAGVSNMGVVASLALLLLGYGLREQYIIEGALAFLAGALIYLFIDLHELALGKLRTPLALVASGIILLGVRGWLRYWLRGRAAAEKAEARSDPNVSPLQKGLLWGGAAFLFLGLNLLAFFRR